MASYSYQPASAPRYACTTTWSAGDTAWQCKDCQLTEYSAICESCFLTGGHQAHDHVVYQSIGGGRCDCGDPSAWKPSGFCKVHTEPSAAPAASPAWGSPDTSKQEESEEENDESPPVPAKGLRTNSSKLRDESKSSHGGRKEGEEEEEEEEEDGEEDGEEGEEVGGTANSGLSEEEDVPEDDGESEEEEAAAVTTPEAKPKPAAKTTKPHHKQAQRKKASQEHHSRGGEEDYFEGLPYEEEDEFQIAPVSQLKNAVAHAQHASRKGDHERAVEYFTQALAYAYLCDMRLATSSLGEGGHEEVMTSGADSSVPILRLHLAMAREYSAQDLYEQALFHTAKALQRCRSHYKVPSVQMATPATMLAHAEARLLVKKQVGAISKAVKLLEEAYALNVSLRGGKDLLNLDILMVHASTHVLAGDRKKARVAGDGSGEGQANEASPTDSDKGANRHYGKAVEDYYLAWEILDSNYGSNCEAMGELYCRIAEALQKQSEDEQAAEMYKKGIGVYKATGPSADSKLKLASACYKLSLLYYRMESYPDALPAIAESVKFHEESLGESHVDTLHALKYLANVNVARENMGEACSLYERALAIIRKVHGSKSRRAKDLETRLADVRRMWQSMR
eukprot:jgi/Mesvir1/16315/Mv12765-RA.2